MRKIAVIAVIFFVLCGIAEAKPGKADSKSVVLPKPVMLIVSQRLTRAVPGERAYIPVVIRVEPHPDNRKLIFEADSPEGDYWRSVISLEREDTVAETMFEISGNRFSGRGGFRLSPGQYILKATVERSSGERFEDSVEVTIRQFLKKS